MHSTLLTELIKACSKNNLVKTVICVMSVRWCFRPSVRPHRLNSVPAAQIFVKMLYLGNFIKICRRNYNFAKVWGGKWALYMNTYFNILAYMSKVKVKRQSQRFRKFSGSNSRNVAPYRYKDNRGKLQIFSVLHYTYILYLVIS